MRGFILHLKRVKEEDLIVTILSESKIKSYYRFYGVRHSILQLGNLIDFEEVESNGVFLDRVQGVSQIPFDWLHDRFRLSIWHNLIKIFYAHLKDSSLLDRFYFELLLKMAKRWDRQNPKRLFCEAFYEVLRFEGRLYLENRCHICNKEITSTNISISKEFLVAHLECLSSFKLPNKKLRGFLESGKTINLEDSEVEILYNIANLGFN